MGLGTVGKGSLAAVVLTLTVSHNRCHKKGRAAPSVTSSFHGPEIAKISRQENYGLCAATEADSVTQRLFMPHERKKCVRVVGTAANLSRINSHLGGLGSQEVTLTGLFIRSVPALSLSCRSQRDTILL